MTRDAVTRKTDARSPRRARPRLPFPPIVGGFLLAGAVLTGATAWLLVSRLNAGALVAYVAGVNLTTFGAYAYDKSVAGGAAGLWRVPEAVLHLLALAGGTPAAFAGRYLLRHKTRKTSFAIWFWVVVAVQVAAVAWWVWELSARA
jgi:uncharacterized membrane protein YsdA (DUF1294 family)